MAWTISEVERRFLSFMEANGHAIIEGHAVKSPTDDVLFTTAGIHPITQYLAEGRPHPAGRRLADVQRCLRMVDVDEVGDNTHLTVFEMLGNWSIGDYFKETAIPMSFRLLTEEWSIDPAKMYVTVFAGDEHVPRDEDSPQLWAQLFSDAGVDPAGRINPLGAADNWWSTGPTGLCGPDSEIFIYVGNEADPTFADAPEFVEIWNNVFLNYDRLEDGSLRELGHNNIDTGMGVARTAVCLNGQTSVWELEEFVALTDAVAAALKVPTGTLDGEGTRSLRIVSDHLRAALVITSEGIQPAATRHGYVLRKLARRGVRHAELLRGTNEGLGEAVSTAASAVCEVMGDRWPQLGATLEGDAARATIDKETAKFAKSLKYASEKFHEFAQETSVFDGDMAFRLADALGYPVDLAVEEAERLGMTIEPGWQERYEELREQQRARSRG